MWPARSPRCIRRSLDTSLYISGQSRASGLSGATCMESSRGAVGSSSGIFSSVRDQAFASRVHVLDLKVGPPEHEAGLLRGWHI